MAYENILTGNDAKSNVYSGTLAASSWSDNTQTLTISGLATTGYAYTVAPASSSFLKYAAAQIYADDITTANSITFHCETTPTEDIDIIILRIQVV